VKKSLYSAKVLIQENSKFANPILQGIKKSFEAFDIVLDKIELKIHKKKKKIQKIFILIF
jgi:hypothetical protein